ncbi:hypothetical protein X975_24143, partial [Stegodyphus mimosarum]
MCDASAPVTALTPNDTCIILSTAQNIVSHPFFYPNTFSI